MSKFSIILFFGLMFGLCAITFGQGPAIPDATYDSVVSVLLAADGKANAVGTGLIVRSDGYVLVPYSVVRGAHEVQVRLRSGEVYDKAEIVATDERRNVAILRINAVGLRTIPNGTVEETQVGAGVYVLTNPSGDLSLKGDMVLKSVQMADDIAGAGKGYRVLRFDSIAGVDPIGGLLLDSAGRSLGVVTTTPEVKGGNIAVPLSSVLGLIRSVQNNTVATTTPTSYPAPSQTPYPIPQNSVLVPQRGVTPLSAKGPGSVVVKPTTIPETLKASKTIYVTSRTVSFKPDQLINALNKRPEMNEWGLTFVDERDLADLVLEIDHVLMTWKYTFKLYSERLGTVIATGDRIILDGNVGANDMAERVIEKLKAARGDGRTPNIQTTDKDKKPSSNKVGEKKEPAKTT
jgi:hypothetical protein